MYRGASDPWSASRLRFPIEIQGERGIGNVTLPDAQVTSQPSDIRDVTSQRVPEKTSAAEFIVHICNKFPGEVSFLFDGPLTNLATAIQLDQDLPSKWVRSLPNPNHIKLIP